MCRHLAWLGAPRTLSALVLDPPFGLLRQSYAPREQLCGRINADGFGVGWYAGTRAEPARYRRAQPIWTDQSFASFAGVVSSGCVLAAVRSATPPFASDEAGAAPFTAGRWLFSHNGSLDAFPTAAPQLRSRLPAAAAAIIEAPTDAALLWALLRHRLESGDPLDAALAGVVAEALAVTTGRLNLLATDGQIVAATTYGDSLYTRTEADGVMIASEPCDDDEGWQRVPHHSLVRAGPDGLRTFPLPLGTGEPPMHSTPTEGPM
jgi:glutamine amidotransferase